MDQFLMQLQFVGIQVTVNETDGEQDSVLTQLYCNIGGCRRNVDAYFDSEDEVHTLACPVHGGLATFPSRKVLDSTIRLAANKILEANGHQTITDSTKSQRVEINGDPRSMN